MPQCPIAGDASAWPVRRQTYGYLLSRRALSLPLSWYSFPVPLRVGGLLCPFGVVKRKVNIKFSIPKETAILASVFVEA